MPSVEVLRLVNETFGSVMAILTCWFCLAERSERQMNRDLLSQAGLRVTREIPIEPGFAAVEAVAAG